MIPAPCYKCEDRTFGCHSTCERYKIFKEKNNKAIETARAYREADTVHGDACTRAFRRKNRKGRR